MHRIADSRSWNSHRQILLKQLDNAGGLPADVERHPEWGYLISRHAGGANAAYVAVTRLKKLWPNLVFKVVNTKDDDDVPWDATVYAKLKTKDAA